MFGCRLSGAKVNGSAVVAHETHHQTVFGSSVWDTHGFFQPSLSNIELVVRSPRLAGYYQIRVAVRWINPWHPDTSSPIPLPSVDDLLGMFYYTYIEINGATIGTEGRSTTVAVTGAKGTTQHFAAERNLAANDTVSLKLWQNFGADVEAFVFFGLRRLGGAARRLAPEAVDME